MTTPKWLKPLVIELKVLAMTAAVAVASSAGEVLNAVKTNSDLIAPLPAWLQGVIVIAAPTLGAFLIGYAAKHTPRPDLGVPAVQTLQGVTEDGTAGA